MTMPTANDWLNAHRGFDGERTPFASWPAIGTRYAGELVDVRQGPNYVFGTRNVDPAAPTQLIITIRLTEGVVNPQTGQVLVGNVSDQATNMQTHVAFQPGQTVAIAVKPGSGDVEAVRSALMSSGAGDLTPGGHFTMTFVAEIPSNKGNPAKKKEATYRPPAAPSGAAAWVAAQPAQYQPAPAPQPNGYPAAGYPAAQPVQYQPAPQPMPVAPNGYPAAQPNGYPPAAVQPVAAPQMTVTAPYEPQPAPMAYAPEQAPEVAQPPAGYAPTPPPGVPGITQ